MRFPRRYAINSDPIEDDTDSDEESEDGEMTPANVLPDAPNKTDIDLIISAIKMDYEVCRNLHR